MVIIQELVKIMLYVKLNFIHKKIKNSYKQIGKINSLDLYIYNNNMELNAVNPLEFINYKYDFKSSMIEKWYKNINDKDKRNIINEVLY